MISMIASFFLAILLGYKTIMVSRPKALERDEIQRCEIVLRSLSTANEHKRSVWPHEIFGTSQFSVVIEAHGMAVRPGGMDDKDIAWLNLWQRPLDCEFIIILAQAAHNVRCDR